MKHFWPFREAKNSVQEKKCTLQKKKHNRSKKAGNLSKTTDFFSFFFSSSSSFSLKKPIYYENYLSCDIIRSSTRKPFVQDACCFDASSSHYQIRWQPSEKIDTRKAFALNEFFFLKVKIVYLSISNLRKFFTN